MLMGPGFAERLAFPAAGEEEETGASPSACLPGTTGALKSFINDLSTFFSLPKPAALISPNNAAVLGAAGAGSVLAAAAGAAAAAAGLIFGVFSLPSGPRIIAGGGGAAIKETCNKRKMYIKVYIYKKKEK